VTMAPSSYLFEITLQKKTGKATVQVCHY
jgi:hypothetical protein